MKKKTRWRPPPFAAATRQKLGTSKPGNPRTTTHNNRQPPTEKENSATAAAGRRCLVGVVHTHGRRSDARTDAQTHARTRAGWGGVGDAVDAAAASASVDGGGARATDAARRRRRRLVRPAAARGHAPRRPNSKRLFRCRLGPTFCGRDTARRGQLGAAPRPLTSRPHKRTRNHFF